MLHWFATRVCVFSCIRVYVLSCIRVQRISRYFDECLLCGLYVYMCVCSCCSCLGWGLVMARELVMGARRRWLIMQRFG